MSRDSVRRALWKVPRHARGVSWDSVRRALGRVPRRARRRHGLRGVGFGELREFKGSFYHERFPINNFVLTRVRLI